LLKKLRSSWEAETVVSNRQPQLADRWVRETLARSRFYFQQAKQNL